MAGRRVLSSSNPLHSALQPNLSACQPVSWQADQATSLSGRDPRSGAGTPVTPTQAQLRIIHQGKFLTDDKQLKGARPACAQAAVGDRGGRRGRSLSTRGIPHDRRLQGGVRRDDRDAHCSQNARRESFRCGRSPPRAASPCAWLPAAAAPLARCNGMALRRARAEAEEPVVSGFHALHCRATPTRYPPTRHAFTLRSDARPSPVCTPLPRATPLPRDAFTRRPHATSARQPSRLATSFHGHPGTPPKCSHFGAPPCPKSCVAIAVRNPGATCSPYRPPSHASSSNLLPHLPLCSSRRHAKQRRRQDAQVQLRDLLILVSWPLRGSCLTCATPSCGISCSSSGHSHGSLKGGHHRSTSTRPSAFSPDATALVRKQS